MTTTERLSVRHAQASSALSRPRSPSSPSAAPRTRSTPTACERASRRSAFRVCRGRRGCGRPRCEHLLVHRGRHRGVRRRRCSPPRLSGCPSARAASSSWPAACPAATATDLAEALPEVDAFVPVTDENAHSRRASSASPGRRHSAHQSSDACPAAHRQRSLGLPAGLGRLPPQRAPTARSRRSAARIAAARSTTSSHEAAAAGRARRARDRAHRPGHHGLRPRSRDGETLADVVRAVAAVPGVALAAAHVRAARRRDRRAARSDGRARRTSATTSTCRCSTPRATSCARCERSGDAERFLALIERIRSAHARRRAAHDPHRRLPGRDPRRHARAPALPRGAHASTTWASSRTPPRRARQPPRCPTRFRCARASAGTAPARPGRPHRLRQGGSRASIRCSRCSSRVSTRTTASSSADGADRRPRSTALVLLDRGEPGEIVQRHASSIRSATTSKAK